MKCGYNVRAVSILINELVDKQAQMDYAKNLGYAVKQSIDEGIEDGCNLLISLSHVPEMCGAATVLKANVSILTGIPATHWAC